MKIETVEEPTRWTVVTEGGTEVFRAPVSGHTKTARAKCERWIEGQKYDLAHYQSSAARTDEVSTWIKEQVGKMPRVARPSIITPTGRKSRW